MVIYGNHIASSNGLHRWSLRLVGWLADFWLFGYTILDTYEMSQVYEKSFRSKALWVDFNRGGCEPTLLGIASSYNQTQLCSSTTSSIVRNPHYQAETTIYFFLVVWGTRYPKLIAYHGQHRKQLVQSRVSYQDLTAGISINSLSLQYIHNILTMASYYLSST